MFPQPNNSSCDSQQDSASPNQPQANLVVSYVRGNSYNTETVDSEQARKLLDQYQNDKTRRWSTESLMETLIDDSRTNKLLACVLVITLLASILNTLLLSFAIGSLRPSDKGLMNGKISWDERIKGSVFELATKLPSKSILLNSIESYKEDRPLVLQYLLRESSLKHQRVDEHDGRERPETSVFLRNTDLGYAANSMAAREIDNCYDGSQKSLLEISTGLFALDLINEQATSSQQQSSAFNKKISLDPNSVAGSQAGEQHAGDERPDSLPLLVLDGSRATVTLPREDRLRINPDSAGSLTVDGQLGCQEISGSLNEDLDIQAHDGGLRFKSGDHMRLVSKTAALKITALEDVLARAPLVSLSASKLYLTGGVHYLDSEDVQSNGSKEEVEKDRRQVKSSGRMRAYNLVAIDGLLMAA